MLIPQKSRRQLGPVVQPVACRTGINGSQGTATNSSHTQFARMRHVLPFGCTGDLRVIEAGFYIGQNSGGFAATGDTEFTTLNQPNAVKRVRNVVPTGGTSYGPGDIITLPKGANDIRAAQVIVLAHDGTGTGAQTGQTTGAPTKLAVLDGGCYFAVQADGVSQASITGTPTPTTGAAVASAGSGATFAMTWECIGEGVMHCDIEPTYGTQTVLLRQTKGFLANGYTPNRDMLVPPGDLLIPDPMPLRTALAAGSAIGTRRYSAGMIQSIQRAVGGGEYAAYGALGSITDYSDTGTVPTSTVSSYCTQPFAIIGRLPAPQPWFLLVGDSITVGAGETGTGDADFNEGWVERGIGSRYPFISLARSSDRYALWTALGAFMKMAALTKLDLSACIVIDAMGVNDLGAGSQTTGAADLLANKKIWWATLLGMGVQEIWTITPTLTTPTSTDGWTTTANQTVSNRDTQRQTYLSGLRDSSTGVAAGGPNYRPYGVTRLIDAALVVEDQANLGKWNVGVVGGIAAGTTAWTADGIHPNTAVHRDILAPLLKAMLDAGYAVLRNSEATASPF